MQIELLYFTVIHTCEHVGCKPYRKNDPKVLLMQKYTVDDERTIYSPTPCKVCAELYERETERRLELANQKAEQRAAIRLEQRATHKRYIVDGQPMTIVQDRQGYWRGQRKGDGKQVQKNFGRQDPRPQLEEVEA